MLKHSYENLINWQYESFSNIPSIKHLVTTKNAQIQTGRIQGLNFSYNVQDDEKAVDQNRKQIAGIFDNPNGRVIIPLQTHSDRIGIVTKETIDTIWEDTDALLTNLPEVIIGVLSADCVPILLTDSVKGVVGVVHAGWKGTTQNIASKTVERMQSLFGSDPKDILAGIGPSISVINYEVGDEIAIQFKSESRFTKDNGKSCVDLWIENEAQLIESGLKKENISIAGMCTYENIDMFYSARREGFLTGRMASFIMLNK